MSRTISNTYTVGVSLTNPGDNPVVVTGTIHSNGSGPALYAAPGSTSAWAITNYGSIFSASNIGISIGNSGTVINSGAVYGQLMGVAIDGSVTNTSKGFITGSSIGVYLTGIGTVVNYGTISDPGHSTNVAIDLKAGGSVTNYSGGTITAGDGSYAIHANTGTTTIVNSGQVIGPIGSSRGASVYFLNNSAGKVTRDGFFLQASSTVINNGVMSLTRFGVDEVAGGLVVNNAGGTISGSILLGGPGTVINAGSISGPVQFSGQGGPNLLVEKSGAVFRGTLTAAANQSNTIELGTGSSPNNGLGGIGSTVLGFNGLTFDPGAKWTIAGTDTASTDLGGMSITGFALGDRIEVVGFAESTESFANNALVLTDAGQHSETLMLAGAFTTTSFSVLDDDFGNSIIQIAPATPVIAGTASGQDVADNVASQIFAAVTITDQNPAPETVAATITMSNAGVATNADGTLSGLGLTQIGTGLYTMSDTSPAALSVDLQMLSFTPTAHQVAPGGTVTTNIALTISDTAGGTKTDTTTSVIATALNTVPTIGGTAAGQTLTDGGTITPFSGVTIADPDFAAMETLTITLTAGGVASDANGTLSGAVTETGTGLYTLAADTPANLTAALDSLVFTPTDHQVAPGSKVTTGMTLSVTDGIIGTPVTDTTTSVTATAFENGPTLAPPESSLQLNDEATVHPFGSITLTDPDFGATETVLIDLFGANVRGISGSDADGTLSGPGLTEADDEPGTYELSAGTPADVTAELRAVLFTPTPHQVAVGQTVSTEVKLLVTDGSRHASGATNLQVLAVSFLPVIANTRAGETVLDSGTIAPFAGVTLSDPNSGAMETLTITLTQAGTGIGDLDGTLAGTGLVETAPGTYELPVDTAANVTTELQSLVFTPAAHQVAPGGTVTTGMSLSLNDGIVATPVTDATTSIVTTAVNDPPIVAGTQAGQALADTATDSPFAGAAITDPDLGATETLTITLTNGGTATDSDGTLSGSGLTQAGPGTYSLAAGTPAAVTAALQFLVFTPSVHQVAPGGTVTTGMTLSVTDGIVAAPVIDATTSIVATAANDAPVIAGTQAGQALADTATVSPFAGVTVTDPDFGATETLTITLTNGGTATDADGTLSGSGLTRSGPGTYSLAAGTPAAVTAALQSVIFTPAVHQVAPGSTVTTGMSLSVTDGIVATPIFDTATTVTATATTQPTIPPATPIVPPATPAILGLAAGSDSGIIGDEITNVRKPIIVGNAPAGDVVTLYDGSTPIGTGIANGSGVFSLTPTAPLTEGANILTVTATDASGNVSAVSAPLSVTLDTIAPAATTLNQTNTKGIIGTAEPGSTITFYSGQTAIGSTRTANDGSWTFLPSSLAAGSYTLGATVTDVAGNAAPQSAALALVVAPDHGFVIATNAGGSIDSRAYSPADILLSDTETPLNGATGAGTANTVTQRFNSAGALVETDTVNAAGLLLQTVTPGSTVRNIYNNAGTLIGTITEAGATNGTAPPGFATDPQTGGATTASDGSGSQVNLLSENNVFAASGADTVTIGTGADTISAGDHAVSVSGGSGQLSFFGGAGLSTVTGGSGSATMFGGAGGSYFQGGQAGGNVLVAGGGNNTLIGGSGGADTMVAGSGSNAIVSQANDVVFAASGQTTVYGSATGSNIMVGGGNDLMIAGGGADNLFGGGSSDTMFGGGGSDFLVGGSGTALMIAGADSTDFVGGSGVSTVMGGSGNDTVWTGAGQMTATLGNGADTVILQSGAATIVGGSGANVFSAVRGYAGGNDLIVGFKNATDLIALYGEGSNVAQQHAGGSTILTLVDGTTITLAGVSNLSNSSLAFG